MRAGIAMLRDSFPNLLARVEALIAEGDQVVAYLWLSGTNVAWYRTSGTGQQVQWRVIDLCRVEDGQIVEHAGLTDRFALLQQLGLIPTEAEIASRWV